MHDYQELITARIVVGFGTHKQLLNLIPGVQNSFLLGNRFLFTLEPLFHPALFFPTLHMDG